VNENLTVTGGVRVGWANASWPLAKLSVSSTNLSIAAMMLGTYNFTPDEVVALEPYQSIPIIGRGIRILHSRSDYPEEIIFWCFRDPEILANDIRRVGFQPRVIRRIPREPRGIPVRWTTIVAVIVIWNVLFVLDGFVPWASPKPPGPFVFLAIALMLAASLAMQRSPIVQAWVLKPGRSPTEIKPALRVVAVVSGLMLLGLALFSLFGQRAG